MSLKIIIVALQLALHEKRHLNTADTSHLRLSLYAVYQRLVQQTAPTLQHLQVLC